MDFCSNKMKMFHILWFIFNRTSPKGGSTKGTRSIESLSFLKVGYFPWAQLIFMTVMASVRAGPRLSLPVMAKYSLGRFPSAADIPKPIRSVQNGFQLSLQGEELDVLSWRPTFTSLNTFAIWHRGINQRPDSGHRLKADSPGAVPSVCSTVLLTFF